MNANVQNNFESGIKQFKYSKNAIDISSLLCQLCNSKLLLNQINETKHMIACSNPKCIFPFNCKDMKRYICESNDLNGFIGSISKLFSRPSTHEESQSDNERPNQEGEDQMEIDEEEDNDDGRVFIDDFY